MFKKIIASIIISLSVLSLPLTTFAAGGIYAYGGGTKNVGEAFTITVTANGATFDALQGTINISGPVSVLSFSGGGATWLPGKSPAAGKEFVGLTSRTNSLTVATIRLQGTKPGTGSVSVSGVNLALGGPIVGSSGGSTSFTIKKAPTPPGEIKISSTTHPDSNIAYDLKTIDLSWDKPAGVTDYAYLLDQADGTDPGTTSNGIETSKSFTVEKIGVYYFHIKAKNGDGWGPTSQFKITLKAAVNDQLEKPSISSIEKTSDFKINLTDGTVSGIVFKGKGINGYTMKLALSPSPEGITLTTVVGGNNSTTVPTESTTPNPTDTISTALSPSPSLTPSSIVDTTTTDWQIISDKPLRAGFYTVSVQGDLNEVLTPASEVIKFEISLAKGGSINILTDADLSASSSLKDRFILGMNFTKHPVRWSVFSTAIIGILLFALGLAVYRKLPRRKKLL